MADAIAIGEYFRSHLDRVLPLIGQGGEAGGDGVGTRVKRILQLEGAASEGGWVRRRTLIEHLGNVKAPDLTQALMQLEMDLLVEQRTVKTATRPAAEWRLLDGQAPRLRDERAV